MKVLKSTLCADFYALFAYLFMFITTTTTTTNIRDFLYKTDIIIFILFTYFPSTLANLFVSVVI
jgi:hypothetical protein